MENKSNEILSEFANMVANELNKNKKPIVEKNEKKVEPDTVSSVAKYLAKTKNKPSVEKITEGTLGLIGGDTTTKTDDPLTPFDQKFVTQEDLQKHYQTFIARIQQQMGTIGGGGEVNLRGLDDVDRETIDDGLFLKYEGATRKFKFVNVNANALITNTTYVTTSEYTVQDNDYYIGVDYAGPTTIILPVSDTNGRCIIIKDEDGDAEINPVTVQGTVDNDAGGFILQINNGSIQLIYRNGWRII